MQGAQQQLGKLYSDQETDKAKLRAKVENEEMKSAIYIRLTREPRTPKEFHTLYENTLRFPSP